MSQVRSFPCQNIPELVEATKDWLQNDGFKCQYLMTDDQRHLLQIEIKGRWRMAVGMSTALNIIFSQDENNVIVEVLAGRWVDKIGVATVSLFVILPLAIPLAVTAGIGAWNQFKMPQRIFDHIASFLDEQAYQNWLSDGIRFIEKILLEIQDHPNEAGSKEDLDKALTKCDELLNACKKTPDQTRLSELVYLRARVLRLSGDLEVAKDQLMEIVKPGSIENPIDGVLQANIYELLAQISVEQNRYDHAQVFLSRSKGLGAESTQRKNLKSL